LQLFNRYVSLREVTFIIGEGFLIFFAVFLASYFFFDPHLELSDLLIYFWPKILLITLVTQFSLYFNDLYEFKVSASSLELATRMVQAIGMTSISLAVIYFIWPDAIIGKWIFFLSLLFLITFLVSWRFLYNIAISKRLFTRKAYILGAGELAKDLLKQVSTRRDLSYDIRGMIAHQEETLEPANSGSLPVRRGFDSLCELAEEEGISHIIVAMDEKRGRLPYKELLSCKVRGLTIIDGESFFEQITGALLVDKINPSWLIFSDGFRMSPISKLMKRLVDFTLALFMFVLLSPLLALVALLVKLDSKGPAIFSQERIGEDNRPFMLHKFRSMKENAEEESGPVWATEDDPRVTRVGRILRKLRIDELPQLWNVIKGEMSFVGPRPERPFFVAQLKTKVPYYRERHCVKPGVTGWAQVMYPYGSTEEDALEKLKYDLYYIKNVSVLFDLLVIFHTVKIVLLGRGSR